MVLEVNETVGKMSDGEMSAPVEGVEVGSWNASGAYLRGAIVGHPKSVAEAGRLGSGMGECGDEW